MNLVLDYRFIDCPWSYLKKINCFNKVQKTSKEKEEELKCFNSFESLQFHLLSDKRILEP